MRPTPRNLKLLLSMVPWLLGSLVPFSHAATVMGDYGVSTTGYLSGTQVNTSAISLTTAGTTWGYISSTGTYLPKLATDSISVTSISTTTLSIANAPVATTDVANKAYVDSVAAAAGGTVQCAGTRVCNNLWNPQLSVGTRSWLYAGAMSDNGNIIAIGNSINGGYIYTSVNGGATWTERTGISGYWMSIDMTADGSTIYAVSSNTGYIKKSTDYGATWTDVTSAGSRPWYSIAVSSDGSKLIAGLSSGTIFTSSDGGVNWTVRATGGIATSGAWPAVAISDDGQKMMAANNSPNLYISTNGGTTWTTRSSSVSSFNTIAMSADGTKLVYLGSSTAYISIDGGTNWYTYNFNGYSFVTMNTSGSKMLLTGSSKIPMLSSDYGQSFVPLTSAGAKSHYLARMNNDGSKIVLGNYTEYLYMNQCTYE